MISLLLFSIATLLKMEMVILSPFLQSGTDFKKRKN